MIRNKYKNSKIPFIFFISILVIALIITPIGLAENSEKEDIRLDQATVITDYEISDNEITIDFYSEVNQTIHLTDSFSALADEDDVSEIHHRSYNLIKGNNTVTMTLSSYNNAYAVMIQTTYSAFMIHETDRIEIFEGDPLWDYVYIAGIGSGVGILTLLGILSFVKKKSKDKDIKKEL